VASVWTLLVTTPRTADARTEILKVAGFGDVTIYAPARSPTAVVLFVSGDGGWNLGVIPMAEALSDRGALVAGVDIRALMRTLDASPGCAYPAGLLEELSRAVQLSQRVPDYKPPILLGYSSGATLVYAALAAAPDGTFAGAISLGFCPDLEIKQPLCQQHGLVATIRRNDVGFDLAPNRQMRAPWMVLQGDIDQVCAPATTRAFVAAIPSARLYELPNVGHGFSVTRNWEPQYLAAYDAVVNAHPREAPRVPTADTADLPLTEVPVPTTTPSETLAVILTGDGGWADIDKSLSAELVRRGIATVGWNSLRYYWTPRTPESAALDLARIIKHYLSAWHASRVVLIGYSFGADVLPFLVNRLPADAAAAIHSVVLLGPSQSAAFEFHVSDWIRSHTTEFLTTPEVARLKVPVTCVQGADERDSACGVFKGSGLTTVQVGRGHHFSGDYMRLADIVIAASR
jgi:type IV secretory pathway VirJ component